MTLAWTGVVTVKRWDQLKLNTWSAVPSKHVWDVLQHLVLWMKKGPYTEPGKLRGRLHGGPDQLRWKVTVEDGLNIKLPNQKRVKAGSHILGLELPRRR